MTYEYKCGSCSHLFDVIKSVAEIDSPESCPECNSGADRQFSFKVHIIGASVQNAEYNPGLGCVVQNKKHREELCKQRGVTEIGNDYQSPDTMHKEKEKEREDKAERRYQDALKEIV